MFDKLPTDICLHILPRVRYSDTLTLFEVCPRFSDLARQHKKLRRGYAVESLKLSLYVDEVHSVIPEIRLAIKMPHGHAPFPIVVCALYWFAWERTCRRRWKKGRNRGISVASLISGIKVVSYLWLEYHWLLHLAHGKVGIPFFAIMHL